MNTTARIAAWIFAYGAIILGLFILGLFLPQVAKLGFLSLVLWTAYQVVKPRR